MSLEDSNRLNYRCADDLLNNAFDFFQTTALVLGDKPKWSKYYSESELKTALLSVTTSVELILKAKIASIDWKEIFKYPSKAHSEALKTGDFESIAFKNCVKKVEELSKIVLSDDFKKKVENIRTTRNQLTHYHFKTSQETFLILASKGIDVFIEFYRLYIKDDFCEEKDRTKELEELLFKIDEYIKIRLQTILPKMIEYKRPKTYYFSECNNCEQDTIILKDSCTVKCLFCESEDNIEKEAEWRSYDNSKVKKCISCDINSMILLQPRDGEADAWECILCGNHINRASRFYLSKEKSSVNAIRDDV